jgi:hypothetical protein
MITIGEKQLTEIREHGVRDYPYECCGLLLGRFGATGKIVRETYPISNAREESAKRNRFLITPEEFLPFTSRFAGSAVAIRPRARLAHLLVHHRFDEGRQCERSFLVGAGTRSFAF